MTEQVSTLNYSQLLTLTSNTLTEELSEKKVIVIVLDISGSTGTSFNGKQTILQKEIEEVKNYVNKYPNYIINLYSFDTYFTFHGVITVLHGHVRMPILSPGTSTYTIDPINNMISKIHNKSINKPDKIIIYTDGQTNSSECQVSECFLILSRLNIKISVVVVSNSNTNLELISEREENSLAGFDLLRYGQNLVNDVEIYNVYHHTIPYKGARSSKVDRNNLQFMGYSIPKITPSNLLNFNAFFNILLENIKKNNILWGENNTDLYDMLIEIGIILSLVRNVGNIFNKDDYIINDMINKLFITINIPIEIIIDFIQHGYISAINQKPIMLTGLERHVKESVVKQQEFKDAVKLLENNGTTLGLKSCISLPYNGYSITIK